MTANKAAVAIALPGAVGARAPEGAEPLGKGDLAAKAAALATSKAEEPSAEKGAQPAEAAAEEADFLAPAEEGAEAAATEGEAAEEPETLRTERRDSTRNSMSIGKRVDSRNMVNTKKLIIFNIVHQDLDKELEEYHKQAQ